MTAGQQASRRSPAPEQPPVESHTRLKRDVVRLNIRGRSVALPGLHAPRTGPLRWLAILGPGVIAGAAGNDAGGIATYSSVGARYGYDLLWVLVLITISLAVVQEMAARLGAATGRGLLDLIRERFGVTWALTAAAIVLIANGGLVITEFVGLGAACRLLGISPYIGVPIGALLVWVLVVAGSYKRVEKVFLLMTPVFFAYPVAAFLAHPDWGAVARGTLVPTIRTDPSYILLLVGLIGTTITPYQQLFQQSSVVDKGVSRRRYGPERIDTYAGMIFNDLMSAFMIIATAATLHVAGQTRINTAADAAQALRPAAGSAAQILFSVGLLGASLIAAAVLPLATAYALSAVFGLPKGVNLNFRRGRFFLSLFSAFVGLGALVALVPGLPVIRLLIVIQVLNGILLPVILVFIMRLANDRRRLGNLANSRAHNILGWATVVLVTSAVVALLGTQLLGRFGIHLLGG